MSRKGITIFVFLLVAAVGAFAYYCHQLVERETAGQQSVSAAPSTSPASKQFQCDGRTRCSQMTSCDEAKFFLTNCPGAKMDGDGDGIPCEQQWCN
jgi:hypothetical protein